MGTIVEDLHDAAQSIAAIARDADYALDFTPRSLWDVERFLDENSAGGQPTPAGLLSKDLGSRVFALGAYIGEVVRSAIGGEWVSDETRGDLSDNDDNYGGDDNDDDARPADDAGSSRDDLTLTLPSLRLLDGTTLWPNQRVMKRIMVGRAESVVEYARAVGVEPGQRPRA